MLIALTRPPTAALVRCALTHLSRSRIDPDRALRQHAAYEAALERAGARVRALPPQPELPDAVFVEDTAVVLDDVAILARPALPARRAELATVEAALAAWRPLERLALPATLDGGDVLPIGRVLHVGLSTRTNADAARQLDALLRPRGWDVVPVETKGALHLKTACTHLGNGTVVLNPAWIEPAAIRAGRRIEVAPGEPFAANTLRVGDALLVPAGAPRTRERLEAAGYLTAEIDIGELQKAEAGLTCLSLLVPWASGPAPTGSAPGSTTGDAAAGPAAAGR